MKKGGEGVPAANEHFPLLRASLLCFAFFQEGAFLQFGEGLAELLLGVHDDGAVPGDGLFEGLAGDEEKADAFIAGLDDDFVAAIEEDERAIVGGGGRGGVQPSYRLGGYRQRLAGVAKFAGAGEDVGKGVAGGLDGQRFSAAGGYGN